MHHYRQALLRMRQGDSDRDIAAARVMGRAKAAQWRHIAREQGWLDPALPLPDDTAIAAVLQGPRRASSTVSTLEAHRERVSAWVEQGVSGTAIHAALRRQHGWAGSYSAVRRLVADIRSQLPPETTCRLDFDPGDAAQVDFGAGPMLMHPDGKPRRTWAFVMTLASSRHQYVEFVWDQTVATWLGCHRRAFEWFAGVPRRVIIDNAKCAITRACAQDPTVQRAYAECAEGYGFKIDPCPPHDPQKKGIVESGVKYLKGNFLPLRTFRDMADLNAQARAWVMDEAGVRCHGTTRRTPLALFALEAPLLKSLPAQAPDLGTWHRVSVHRDCHVQFERVLYSAPFALVGKLLWLRATDAVVALFEDYRHVATHPRGQRPGQRVSVREHLPPEAQAFFGRGPRLVCGPGRAHRRVLPGADRAPAQRPHPGAAARRTRRARLAQALWPAAPGGRLRPGDGAQLTVLPHRQDHPGHWCRSARRCTGAHPARLWPHPLHPACHRVVRRPHPQPAARLAALTQEGEPP